MKNDLITNKFDEDFVEIPLTRGKVAIIDKEDLKRVGQWKWSALPANLKMRENFYAHRTVWHTESGKRIQRSISLHRLIMNFPRDLQVDHINGDGLDCRKVNLRLATRSQNSANCFKNRINQTGFRGVQRRGCIFMAKISINGKQTYLGTFKTAEDAARAYDKKAVEIYGEFATLNFPEG